MRIAVIAHLLLGAALACMVVGLVCCERSAAAESGVANPYDEHRYQIAGHPQGVFVLDRRNGQVWFCRDLGSGGRCVKHANLPEMIP